MLKLANEHCPKADYKTGSILDIKYEDNYFDICTSSLVLDHVKDIDKAADEVKRVIKPYGLFIFSIPHPVNNMFRESEKSSFVPSHDYYDETSFKVNIAGKGKVFPEYPRTMEAYMQPFFSNGFKLIGFKENEPQYDWKERFEDIDQNTLKVPQMCFFKWRL